MDLGLKQKVIIITGGARGIGADTAAAFAEEGAYVVINDVDLKNLERTTYTLRAKGYDVIGIPGDVTRSEEVSRVVEETVKAFGNVHVLINNAGFPRDGYITRMPEADWDAVVDVVLKGAYLCSKAVLPHMMKQQWGRIINISSRAHLGNPGQANYSAAKAGLLGFTRALSYEQGKFQITVNAIAPGFIDTELVRQHPNYATIKAQWETGTPVQRIGRVRDVADAALFLASERAGFISGECLHVTGGRYSN